jgi:hypothetical protein
MKRCDVNLRNAVTQLQKKISGGLNVVCKCLNLVELFWLSGGDIVA